MRAHKTEYRAHQLINIERSKRKLSPVQWHWGSYKLAKTHARYMSKRRRIFHSDRFAFEGGENVAMLYGRPTARALVKCWMTSSPHRAFLLHKDSKYAAVGIVRKGNRSYAAWTFYDCRIDIEVFVGKLWRRIKSWF